MDLGQVLHPVTVADLRRRYFGRRPFVLVRRVNPLAGLFSVEELEQRLNDGCSSLNGTTFIDPTGTKIPLRRLYVRPSNGWSGFHLRKRYVLELLESGHSFVLHNMSQTNREVAELVDSIEQAFPGHHADVHVYASPRARATSFRTHRDPHHKIYVQMVGSTRWTVYKGHRGGRALPAEEARGLAVDIEATLTPGGVLYLPPERYHRVENPDGARLSLSIPFAAAPDKPRMDRTAISLLRMFEG
jgi:ribosomal protein L16 Arg81 hydroxylase